MTFGDLLREQMQAKKISAADLARAVWGTTTDYRGYTVARGRDRIGHYLAGTSFPEKENLQKIAAALRVPVKILEATRPPPKLREAHSPGEIMLTLDDDGRAVLSMNKVSLTFATARKIMALVKKDLAA